MDYKFTKEIFVESQIPFFIRDNYPLFVSLVKSYYEFLSRKQNEIIAVKVKNPGKKYTSPNLSIKVLDIYPNSATYGQFVDDTRPVDLVPVMNHGRIEKVIVKNSKNVKYLKEELPTIYITDSTGSGADLELIVLFDMGNVYDVVQDMSRIRDVDVQNDIFRRYVLDELIPTFPTNLYSDESVSVETEKFVKFIKQIYNSKGIEAVFSFIYRVLYNTTVNIYYPKTDILRVSDGVWIKNYYLVVEDDLSEYVGEKIVNQNGITGIIMSNEQHPTLTGKWKVLIHERTGNFSTNDDIYIFNFKFTYSGIPLTTVHSVEEDPTGYFKNDNGQLSSTKKIQDNYYYQEFSYEIQSEFNIKEFSLVLNELLNPAGFKYFIRILVNLEVVSEIDATLYYNEIKFSDIEIVSGEDAFIYKRGMGLTLADIYKKFFTDSPVDVNPVYTTATIPTNTNISEVDIYNVTNLNSLLEQDTFAGYSVYFYESAWSAYRTITKTVVNQAIPENSTIYLDNTINHTSSTINVEIWPGYYFKNVVNSTTFELSDYDPLKISSGNNSSDPEKRYLIGYSLYILKGNVAGERKKIVAYNGLNGTVVIDSPFSTTPTNSIYRIINDLDGTEYFGGELSAVNVIKGGSGYTTASFVVDSPPGGSAPTFSVSIDGGAISSINIVNSATAKYYTIPTSSLTGDGSGAVYEIIVDLPANSYISEIMSKNRFQGLYFELEKDALGNSAYYETARIRVLVANEIISSVIIEDSGKGYWFIPRIYQKVGDGTFGKIMATVASGQLSNTTITGFGLDYNYNPEFAVEPSDPTISTIFSQTSKNASMKLIYSPERDSFWTVICSGGDRPDINSSNKVLDYYGNTLNINVDSVMLFYTGFFPVKASYTTEIEVIR